MSKNFVSAGLNLKILVFSFRLRELLHNFYLKTERQSGAIGRLLFANKLIKNNLPVKEIRLLEFL